MIDLTEENEEHQRGGCGASSSSSSSSRLVAGRTGELELQSEMQVLDGEIQSVERERDMLETRLAQLHEKRASLALALRDLNKQRAGANRTVDWSSERFAHSKAIREAMKQVWGFESFRGLQLCAINATLAGNHVFVVMPTGAGKSLCYQLPAVYERDKVTLVVSPLLSLSQDQVLSLVKKGVHAAMLCAESSKEDTKLIFAKLLDRSLSILYVTPEKVLKSKTLLSKLEQLHKNGGLARIVVDEAHCCSSMGHDFRPDYLKLGLLHRQFPNVPILAVTATATIHVEKQVRHVLLGNSSSADEWIVFRSSFNRRNLYYVVREKPSGSAAFQEEIARTLHEQFPGQIGIIYCMTRKETETLAAYLGANNIKAASYHAYMEPYDKVHVHEHWLAGRIHVIVATSAFGMGIDNPDVRFVIHQSLCKNMEAYLQESGRAGRDGKRSTCILYYRRGDIMRVSTLLADSGGSAKILDMIKYCEAKVECRRASMARGFGETFTSREEMCGNMCDNCVERLDKVLQIEDFTKQGQDLIRALQRIVANTKDKRATMAQLVDAWCGRGKLASQVDENWRAPKHWTRDKCEELIANMIAHEFLRIIFAHTAYSTNSYLATGYKSKMLLEKKTSLQFYVSSAASKAKRKGSSASKKKSKKKRQNVIVAGDNEDGKRKSMQNSDEDAFEIDSDDFVLT